MSMNLYFQCKNGHSIDFPYQTRTEISYQVINTKTLQERMQIFQDDLKYMEDIEHRNNLLARIRELLLNKDLRLRVG